MKIDKKIIMPSILVLVASVLVITLAYFGAEIIENGVNPTGVTTGSLDVSLSDSAVSVSNLKPIYAQYVDSMAYKKEFTITNAEDSLDSSNDIYLNISNISDELKSEYFKYKVVVDGAESGGNFSSAVNGERLQIYNDLAIKSNTSKTISLYIWIEYAEGIDQLDMLGRELSANLWLESTDMRMYTLYEKILADNPTIRDDNAELFESVADEIGESGLFRTTDLTKTEDIDGDGTGEEVLYFRGVVENNYVVFAGYCWRIVRTNEDGSVRLRYNGEYSNGTCPVTGTDVNINNTYYYFDSTYNIGYMYDSSTAKTEIDNWYRTNIESKGENVTSLIVDTPYCNDTTFGAYTRLNTNKSPQFKCPNTSDKYTVDATKGNGKLSKPVALLTADEVAYAGGVLGFSNLSYYLYTGADYWTMSPYDIVSGDGGMFFVFSDGTLDANFANYSKGLFPVVSLKAETMVNAQGNGTYTNPYVVES